MEKTILVIVGLMLLLFAFANGFSVNGNVTSNNAVQEKEKIKIDYVPVEDIEHNVIYVSGLVDAFFSKN